MPEIVIIYLLLGIKMFVCFETNRFEVARGA